MTVRRRRLTLLLVAALGLAAACTDGGDATPAASGQELKIGLLAPLKGANARAGTEAKQGAELAADVINGLNPSIPLPLAADAGLPRLGGARVRIITADATPANSEAPSAQIIAGNTVNKLVSDDGVNAIIGAYDPQVTEYASQRSERYEVPFVNADSPATFLTDAGRDWFFRIGPSWRSAGEAFYSALRDKDRQALRGKTVILHADDKAGRDVVTTVSELAAEGGLPKPEAVSFPPAATDLQDVVNGVKARKPDTVILYVTPVTIKPLITAFAAAQFKPKAAISFSLGYLTAADFKASASVVNGLVRSVSWSAEAAERNPAARAITAAYQRKFNTAMTEAAASAFTAVMTVAQAVDAAGSTDAQRVRSALLSLNVPGEQTVMPWAGIQFDETHQNVYAQSLLEQFTGSAFTIVYPSDAASGPLVWPAVGATV